MSDLAWLGRTKLLVGDEGIQKLQNAHVLVVGLGGVGSFAAEFVARSGVGTMTIVDGDVVDPSNRNRQLPALATNHGEPKADIMTERLLAINPELKLTTIKEFLSPEAAEKLLSENQFDYVMDCIDSITPKLTLLSTAYNKGLKIVSSMGAGGKVDPTLLRTADLFETRQCYLASLVRKRLRKMGIRSGIKAVFSLEKHDDDSLMLTDGSNFKKSAYGTISYIPAAFGGVCASVVIRDLLGYPIKMEKKPKEMVAREKKQKKK
ncbi:tRNA threonylcarbamoyladenosine dehydratase [Flectobacillus rivi]|uniref:tRNA threonylcarbamoyladenosine dehydratase n=1 Tax=Flectobacillus rivi TaxID=2984209 RepID=A0ABT6YXG9_9BACT|nr:tRNA threonylcarbamoyladenosine dehydratase [Flectobacillus rivi]MDI9873099.1 tRNA threonylcarbamoyladenosine dehydratase [Flectobacillus rivi]